MDSVALVKREFTLQAEAMARSDFFNTAQLIDLMKKGMGGQRCDKVLDLACGPGILTAALAPVAGEIIGLDLTEKMLEKGAERCARDGLTNAHFVQGLAEKLPFDDGYFDAAVTRLSLHHFIEPHIAIGELSRVLKPGGVLVLADVTSSEDAGKAKIHNAFERLRDPTHVRMLTAAEIELLLTDNGFKPQAAGVLHQTRRFDEWAAIVRDARSLESLRTLMGALARLGEDAGVSLDLEGDMVTFSHNWLVISSRKG